MTITELLKLNPEGLEAMSDEELKAHLVPYIQDVRPAVPVTGGRAGIMRKKDPSKAELRTLLKQLKAMS